tara:strand:- start:2530 stop:3201 length:672 start_codon:yes stop_codon:yes gene_type:complete
MMTEGLPFSAVDYFGNHHDIIQYSEQLRDAHIAAQAAYHQILETGRSVSYHIPVETRPAVSVAIGLNLAGVVFTWKALAEHFRLDLRLVRRYFHRVSRWNQPRFLELQYGDAHYRLMLPLHTHYRPPSMEETLEGLASRLGKPELSEKCIDAFNEYQEMEPSGAGSRRQTTFAAALLYIASNNNNGSGISLTGIAKKLHVSKNPIFECAQHIEKITNGGSVES